MILSEVSIRRPVFASVLSLLILLIGAVCFQKLSVREYPKIDEPVVSVQTRFTGASAEVMEAQVTKVLEDSLSGIEGLDVITSSSRPERSLISVRFALSREARDYLRQTYGAPPENIRICPLGVPLAAALARPSQAGHLHVVSVSFCLPVKRLDKIVDAIGLLARHHPGVGMTWTHIGNGPLLQEIQSQAWAKLASLGNVVCSFPGELPNHAVKAYYLNVPVDMLVNASESEGVPVSIMEAMSAGVPAIAPDVGGISSLVSDRCGALLGPCSDAREIAGAMERVAFADGRDERRTQARRVIEARFDAARNYRDFVAGIVAMGAPGDRQPAQPPARATYRIGRAARR